MLNLYNGQGTDNGGTQAAANLRRRGGTGGGTVTGAFSNAGGQVTSNGRTFAIGYISSQVVLTDVTSTAIAANNSAAGGQSITDKQTATPFAGVTVNDGSDTGETYRASISCTAANGVLAAGSYQVVAASAAPAQADLRAPA